MSVDLVCVVADKCIEAALSSLLDKRRRSIGIRELTSEIHVHSGRDPGCYGKGVELIQGLISGRESRGLLVFDQHWDGNPHATAAETEAHLREEFERLPIEADVVVIDPEIEAWVWTASPHVPSVLGWEGDYDELARWLRRQDLWSSEAAKPDDPKKAMEVVLHEQRIPRSSSLYRRIAEKASLRHCRDRAFQRFCDILRGWFPADS